MIEEIKQKKIHGLTGRKMPEETKQKISASLTGRKMSEETKQKISMSLKGKTKCARHTFEECYNIAQKYTALKDFAEKDRRIYRYSLRNGWLDSFTWIERKHKKHKKHVYKSNYKAKLTYDVCKKISQQYTHYTKFAKDHPSHFSKCRRNGWLTDFTWLVDDRNYGYKSEWVTYDYCYEQAQKCGNITEFSNTCGIAYRRAKQEGWINDYSWFNKDTRPKKKEFCIYVYEDIDNKMVYIGLTKDIRRRHRQHSTKVPHTNHYDRVKEYFLKQGKDLPAYEIVTEELYDTEAQFYESLWIETYKSHGWNILNKSQTGTISSSLGSYTTKWTEEICREIAQKYKTLKDFSLLDNKAYQASIRNGWINSYTWLQKERCKTPILEIDRNGKLIQSFKTLLDASKKLNISKDTVRKSIKTNTSLKNGNFLIR